MSECCLRNKKHDTIIFVAMLLILLFGVTPRILVYYTCTPTRISLEAIAADGTPIKLATPPQLEGTGYNLGYTKKRIRDFLNSDASYTLKQQHPHLIWSVQYGENNIDFGQVITFSTGHSE